MKKLKKYSVPIAVGIIVLTIVICAVSQFTSRIDLSDYITVEDVHGLNGQGVISYSVNVKALALDLYGSKKDVDLTEDNLEEIMGANIEKLAELSELVNSITLTADPEFELENGDKVTIKAKLENTNDYDYGKRIKDGSVTYTVRDLLDGKEFDPFSEENMNLTFTGFSGQGKADLKLPDHELSPYIKYNLSKSKNLSNEETVTVTVQINALKFEELGYLTPDETEKTYTVTGLPEYISEATKIPAAVVSELKDTAMEKAKAAAKKMDAEGYSIITEPEYIETFFAKVNDPSVSHKDVWYGLDMNNGILVMTHVTLLNDFYEKTYEYWYTYLFPDWYISETGELRYDEEGVTELKKVIDTKEEALQWINKEFSDMTVTSTSK